MQLPLIIAQLPEDSEANQRNSLSIETRAVKKKSRKKKGEKRSYSSSQNSPKVEWNGSAVISQQLHRDNSTVN